MSIKNLSVTAASNNAAAPNGAPEGMTIASVNDTMRQTLAEIRTLAAPSTIAAAATTDIGTKDETFLTLTGTAVTITALGTVSAGIYKAIIYNAAHTLTHNATSLILVGGANRTVAAGDASLFVSEGSGNWRELFFSDVSETLTSYAPKTGYTSTGDIIMSGNSAIEESRANITQHATTMDFWAGPNILDGAGSAVTITACVNAPQAGARRKFYPLVSTILTHGATFDIDGNVNQTAAAGDCWEIVAKTTSTYKVHVTKDDGTAVVAANKILQVAYAELATSGTTPALIPADDTIPQNTEGTEILTCAITPQSATSYLLVQVCANLSEDTNTTDSGVIAAIFRDATASAIAAQIAGSQATGGVLSGLSHGEFNFQFRVAAVSTALTTFKLHVGGENAGTYRWNGAGTRRFGGVYLTTITLTEIAA